MEPEKALRRLLLIVFVPLTLFAVLFVGVCWYLYHLDAHEGYTGEAQGEVVKVDFAPERIEVKQMTTIHYRYVADGRAYDGEVSEPADSRKDYKAGQKLRICYSPQYPSLSYLLSVESEKKCGDKIRS